MADNPQNNPQGLTTQITDGPKTSDDVSTATTVQLTATAEVPQSISEQVQQHRGEPLPEIPTREFFDRNYRKPDLKRCRELGLTNVWSSNKSQLIDMIIQKTWPVNNGTTHDVTHSPPSPHDPPSVPSEVVQTIASSDTTHENDEDHDWVDILEISRKIKIITSKLETKDLELDLLKTQIKTAYRTILQLQKRITELEQHYGRNGAQHHASTLRSTLSNNCLLLGDTNLRKILRSDLQENYWIRTIFKADMDLLRSWKKEKLSQTGSECILYDCIFDIHEEKSPTSVLNNLSFLIAALKEKNSAMKVHVSQLVPPPMSQEIQAKTIDYNEHLMKWGEANGINITKTVSAFMLSTGEVDDICFDMENNPFPVLNRLGAIKLLSTIKNQYPYFQFCTDWEEIK